MISPARIGGEDRQPLDYCRCHKVGVFAFVDPISAANGNTPSGNRVAETTAFPN